MFRGDTMSTAEKILQNINELRTLIGPQSSKKLDLDTFRRIVIRLDSYKESCNTCMEFLEHTDKYFENLISKNGIMSKEDLKRHRDIRTELVVHLMKQHKLVQKGQYMALFMSIGMAIGAVLGLTVLNNQAIGLPAGLVMGIAMGNAVDHDAKRKGRVI